MPRYFMGIVEQEGAYASAGEAEFNAVMAAHRSFAEAVKQVGASIVSSEALQPSATASFLRGTRTDDVQVVDNPLPEVKEVFGGYYLIDAADDATAAELARLCPAPYGYIELRPIWEMNS